jgi:hypothetical protein
MLKTELAGMERQLIGNESEKEVRLAWKLLGLLEKPNIWTACCWQGLFRELEYLVGKGCFRGAQLDEKRKFLIESRGLAELRARHWDHDAQLLEQKIELFHGLQCVMEEYELICEANSQGSRVLKEERMQELEKMAQKSIIFEIRERCGRIRSACPADLSPRDLREETMRIIEIMDGYELSYEELKVTRDELLQLCVSADLVVWNI